MTSSSRLATKVTAPSCEITVASPEWRGKLLPSLQPVARQEGSAVWALDAAGIKDLLAQCEAD